MSIATFTPRLRLPDQLRIEGQDTPVLPAATPAALEFALLEAWLASRHALQLPLHQIEAHQQSKGREVQRLLLQAPLQQRGDGDVGPGLRVQQEAGEVFYTHRRLSTRSLKTIFETVEIVRLGYSRAHAPSLYPLDQTLALPARSFSYQLQRRLVKAAVQNPFQESVEAIAELTGVSVSKRSLEEMLRDAALDFDAFYQQRAPEPAAGSILVAAVDGKGIPMVKPGGAPPRVRLTKGQKANRLGRVRQREVGVRSALGAVRRQIVANFLRQGLRVTVLGCIAGLILSLVVSRLLSTMLYGVSALDAETYFTTLLLILSVATLASLLPAWRAANVDPIRVLRQE